MNLQELRIANLLNAEVNAGGIKNPVDQKDNSKTDAESKGMWGVTVERG